MSPHTVTTGTLAPHRAFFGRAAVITVIALAGTPLAAEGRVWRQAQGSASYARISGDLEANKVRAMDALSRHAAEHHQNAFSRYGDLEAAQSRRRTVPVQAP